MAACDRCGSHISQAYARVFADPAGRVEGCPACESPLMREMA